MRSRVTMLIAALLVATAGCSDEVAGPSGVAEPFSVYGIINPRLDTQTVLVSPITDQLFPLGTTIDADVRSIDLATGEEYVWRDSVVENETGQFDHVFWSGFRPSFDSQHSLTVTCSDGQASGVEVRIPGEVEIRQEDFGTRNFDVIVSGEDFSIMRNDITYDVRFFEAYRRRKGPASRYTFSHDNLRVCESAPWGVRFRLDLGSDYEAMQVQYHNDHVGGESFFAGFWNPICDGLGLFGMEINFTIVNDDWDPPGAGSTEACWPDQVLSGMSRTAMGSWLAVSIKLDV